MKISRLLENQILRVLAEELGTDREGALLVGVSGGSDSTALLRLLHDTRRRHGRRLVAGHVNHGVRRDADAEEERLREICRRLSVPFRSARLDFGPRATPPPPEAALRKARHAALLRLAREEACAWIVLGHQRDDQAETVLLNLLRGSGPAGLAGMAPRRGRLLRPLLTVPRSVLRAYLEEIGESSVEDPTNLDLSRARNRIRHEILPLLEAEVRPRSGAAIARAAAHVRAALDALDAQARAVYETCRLPGGPLEIRLDAGGLRAHPAGLIERVLRLAIASARGSTADIPAPIWRRIAEILARGSEGRFALPASDLTVGVTGRVLRIAPAVSSASGPPAPVEPIDLRLGETETVRFGRKGGLKTRMVSAPEGKLLKLRGIARLQVFDAHALRPPVRIRLSRPGDALSLDDSTGSRKLSDLLSEQGVPRDWRPGQPVLVDAGGILWAPGIRRAARALVGPETKRIWIVRWFGDLPGDHALKGGVSKR